MQLPLNITNGVFYWWLTLSPLDDLIDAKTSTQFMMVCPAVSIVVVNALSVVDKGKENMKRNF